MKFFAKIKSVPKKVWIIAAAAIIIITVIVVLAVMLGNKFRLGVVEQIQLGSSKGEVISILGEPYGYNETEDDEDNNLFTYYSNNLSPGEITQDGEYQYIEVNFNSEGSVVSVFFDAARTEQTKDEPKAIEGFEILTDAFGNLIISDGIQYTVHYIDGSYYMGIAGTYLNTDNETYIIEWNDIFGNDYEYLLSKNDVGDSIYSQPTKTLHIFSNDGFNEKYEDIENIIIYDGVTRIDRNAFEGNTTLTNISIPDSIKSIGWGAFDGCTALKNIEIPYGVTNIGENTFRNCSSLTNVIIPNSVESIGGSAFSGCTSLTSVSLPNSVKSIGKSAFENCTSLTDLTIGNSVKSIDERAFYGCEKLNAVYITDIAAWCNIEFTRSFNQFVYSSNPLYYAHNLYLNGELVTELVIPDSITSIGDYAFIGCSSLTNITIPDSVTSIGQQAFSSCSSLTNINVDSNNNVYHSAGNCLIKTENKTLIFGCQNSIIPNDSSVTSIGDYAFYYCTSLESIDIPENIATIGNYAFRGCNSLINITISDGVTSIGEWAFSRCLSLESIAIPNSITSIGNYAFMNCTSLTDIIFSESATSIGDYTFSGCTSLINITIGDGVTSIGWGAFSNCTSLTSVDIGDGVTSISNYAFNNCTSLTSVTIGSGVKSLNNGAFNGCKKLIQTENGVSYVDKWVIDCNISAKSVSLRSDTVSIADYAFYDCSSLTSIMLPDGIKNIGYRAFNNCTTLESINIPDSVTSIGGYAFSGCTNLIQTENGVSYVDKWVIGCNNSITSISLRSDTVGIADSVFYNRTTLENINIPDSVKSIGDYAFYGCSSLETVYYTGTEDQWNEIDFGWSNDYLTDAEIIFNYEG